MKHKIFAQLAIIGFIFISCEKQEINTLPDENEFRHSNATAGSLASITVPLGGNAYITKVANSGATETIASTGLTKWKNSSAIASAYFRLGQTGQLSVSIKAAVPSGSSKIKVTVNGTAFTINLSGKTAKTYTVGTVNISAAGYVKVDFQGVSKTGTYYANVSDLIINGTATASNVAFANDAANFYWSRRGPSVHLRFAAPSGFNTAFFYAEINVPPGQDQIGSYYMSNGFTGGYFGIQVNSATERRVLFSVWDPATGKTTLVKKGIGVVDNSFSGEGTGGQSYLVFNWKAGTTYKFLTQAQPDSTTNTTFYTSWIYTPESSSWRFIATWKKPNTYSYLTGLYSFLECFNPENSYWGRKAYYKNQWVCDANGNWVEITSTTFTGDATAVNNQRMDYAGGVENGDFYLQHDGFFANYVPLNSTFTRPATNQLPDLNTLP